MTTDASAGWREEYHAADVSTSIAPTCEIEHCGSRVGLQLVETAEGWRQLCRRHVKAALGVSS